MLVIGNCVKMSYNARGMALAGVLSLSIQMQELVFGACVIFGLVLRSFEVGGLICFK